MSDGDQSAVSVSTVDRLVDQILTVGIKGAGPMKGAAQIADEHLKQYWDRDRAIDRLIRTHVRLSGMTGFAAGLGGLLAMPLTIPADVGSFYVMAGRCAASVAHLRGYDLDSDEARSIVLISLLGSAGAGVAGKAGAHIGNKMAMAALKELPGSALFAINRAVGFRLLTKFGTTGAINLVKVVPLVGGGVGAGVNAATMRTVGTYAKSNFPLITDTMQAAESRAPRT